MYTAGSYVYTLSGGSLKSAFLHSLIANGYNDFTSTMMSEHLRLMNISLTYEYCRIYSKGIVKGIVCQQILLQDFIKMFIILSCCVAVPLLIDTMTMCCYVYKHHVIAMYRNSISKHE